MPSVAEVSDLVRALLVVAIIVYVIARQVAGEPLRGRRVVLLPVVVTVLGAVDISGSAGHVRATDVLLLAVNALVAAALGVAQGVVLRLESRDGYLWARLPARGLWLWAALFASRAVLTGVAYAVHAHVAASGAAILLVLGINRLAQAAVVVPRALAAGVPFAPERDGRTFLSGLPRDRR